MVMWDINKAISLCKLGVIPSKWVVGLLKKCLCIGVLCLVLSPVYAQGNTTTIPNKSTHTNHKKKSHTTSAAREEKKYRATPQDINKQWTEISQQPGACSFVPPKGWKYVVPAALPRDVKVMVKGKGKRELPPTMNLAIESVSCTQNEYVLVAKRIHEANPQSTWSDLGTINTRAGKANLWQIDTKTNWGEVRMLQAMVVRSGKAFILTAGALKSEYPTYHSEFIQALQTLTINKSIFEMIEDPLRREHFREVYIGLQESFSAEVKEQEAKAKTLPPEEIVAKAFEDPVFREEKWDLFCHIVQHDYADMGHDWQEFVLKEAREQMVKVR